MHLYNLKRSVAIKNASLRDQCYRHKFYGATDQVEDDLSILEGYIAPVLQSIVTQSRLPAEGTEEYLTLLAFVALQLLRTTTAANRINDLMDKSMKQIYSKTPPIADADMDSMRFGYQDPVLVSLAHLPDMLDAISDLRGHLSFSKGNNFITSDNPTFKYNQYCEGIQYVGITGALSRGLQIFVPLGPRLNLVLYDSTTYIVKDVKDRSSGVSTATESDVDWMNTMQLLSADQNVYYANWQQLDDVRRLVPTIEAHRTGMSTAVVEYGQDDDPNSSLLQTFERTPFLKLRLSFLSLRMRARRVPLEKRAQDFRKELPFPALPDPPGLKGRTVTFSRFIGRR